MLRGNLMHILLRLSLGGTIGLLAAVGAAQIEEPDLPPPFASAHQVADQTTVQLRYRWILGAVVKIGGQYVAGKEQRIDGDLLQRTFEVDQAYSTQEIFQYYQGHLQDKQFASQYLCQGRDCGSSHIWATQMFKQPLLYGRDESQYYLTGRLSLPQGERIVSLYVVQRGNRRNYVHVEVLTPAMALPSAQTLESVVAQLHARSRLSWQPQQPDEALVALLAQAVLARRVSQLMLVGHAQIVQGNIVASMQQGLLHAQTLAQHLQAAGVAASLLQVHSAGGLAPGYGRVADTRVEIILLSH